MLASRWWNTRSQHSASLPRSADYCLSSVVLELQTTWDRRKNPSHPHRMSTFRTGLCGDCITWSLQWRELQTVRCSPGVRSPLMGVVLVDHPTRLHTDKRGKLGLSPIAVSRSTMATSNSSTTALDATDLSEVHSPINDRDQDTVSSATNNLGGKPVALGHRTSDIVLGSSTATSTSSRTRPPQAPPRPRTMILSSRRMMFSGAIYRPQMKLPLDRFMSPRPGSPIWLHQGRGAG